ncbi:hypothetical protein GN109_15150 [Collimonas pratensis]|uniref:hypothetical protein n=1 Tax=Collimonas pratensis TaxID=279113 RepID=UPI00143D2433|nr:hypothetical protein [Collimonas pratensis]NKI70759.1 hypothetical protein [Collimonas pratensis]
MKFKKTTPAPAKASPTLATGTGLTLTLSAASYGQLALLAADKQVTVLTMMDSLIASASSKTKTPVHLPHFAHFNQSK